MTEEANERANIMFNFLLKDAKTTIEAYEALPQLFKDWVNLSRGIEPGMLKEQNIIDKERYLKIIEAGIDSLGIGSSRKV